MKKKHNFFFVFAFLFFIYSAGSKAENIFRKNECRKIQHYKIEQKDSATTDNTFEYIKVNDFLYKDSTELYLRVPGFPKNDLDTITTTWFLKDVYILQKDSISTLKNTIDIHSFKRISTYDIYFMDKKYVYVYNISRSPEISTLDINKSKLKVLGLGHYIKDDRLVYWIGKPLENADAKTFDVMLLHNISDDYDFEIGADKNTLFDQYEKITLDQLKAMSISNEKMEFLRNKYFK